MKRILPVLSRPLRAGFLALALGSAAALIAAPSWISQLNYQGQLTDNLGEPVADGSYTVSFRIYKQAVGGVPIWSENQNVTVTKGLFNVVLGSSNNINLSSTDVTDDLWVALDVNSNGEMSPRQQLLSAVYAWNAERLNGYSVGTGADNIVKLDGSGKIPASMISGGSVGAPLDVSGNNASYILRANNTGTGMALSAAASSTTQPALFAEGAKFGVVAKTNDAAQGVALQAFGPSSAYASLVDRVNNAQVFGQANAVNYLGVFGANTNASGTGLAGTGGAIGVSGSGGTYGVYGRSANTGVYGVGGNGYSQAGVYGNGYYGVHGYSSGNYGVRAESTFIGLWASGTSYGTWSESPGSAGVYGIGSGSTSFGVWGSHQGSGAGQGVRGQTSGTVAGAVGVFGMATQSTGATYGVQGQSSSSTNDAAGVYGRAAGGTGVIYGVHGETGSTTVGSAGVYGEHTGSSGIAVRAQATGTSGLAVSATANNSADASVFYNLGSGSALLGKAANTGVKGESTASYGAGVEGVGYYGVKGYSNYTNFYSETSNNPSFGFYHYHGSAAASTYAIYALNQGATSYGAYIYNNVPTATDGGYALRVYGKFQAPLCSGKYTHSGLASSWVLNTSTVGSATANCIESNTNVLVTPAINIGAASLYVSSVAAGSATIASNSSINNMSFYYWIVNE